MQWGSKKDANSSCTFLLQPLCLPQASTSKHATANSVPEIKMFGTMGNIWKLFSSPKKAESLKAVQSVIKLPELKIVKPSDTRLLSHERSVLAIYRELPALIVTPQQLYETSGDAEGYGIGALLATYIGVASIVFLSEVLDILARMNVSMQRKLLDLSRLPVLLKITTDQLKHLKDERREWLGSVESEISLLKEKHDITLGAHGSAHMDLHTWICTHGSAHMDLHTWICTRGSAHVDLHTWICTHGSARSCWSSMITTAEYRTLVAIPYVDSFLLNILRVDLLIKP